MLQTEIHIPYCKGFQETFKEKELRVQQQNELAVIFKQIFKNHFGEDCFSYIRLVWSDKYLQVKQYKEREISEAIIAKVQRDKEFRLTKTQYEKIQNHIADRKGAERLKERQQQNHAEFKKALIPIIADYAKDGVRFNYIVTGGMGTIIVQSNIKIEIAGKMESLQMNCDIYPTDPVGLKIDIYIDQNKGFDYVLKQVEAIKPHYKHFFYTIEAFKNRIPIDWWTTEK